MLERFGEWLGGRRSGPPEEADAPDLARLLSLHPERCGEDAPTHDRDERSPVHQSIT
jgi:hypothetical protein